MFEHPLEERCHQFGKRVRGFCRKVKKDLVNFFENLLFDPSNKIIGKNVKKLVK